jgi:hypothetical protein
LFASTAIAPFSAAIVGIAFVSFAGTTLLYLWHLSSQVKQGAYLNMPAFFFWIASILFLLPFALPISNFDVGWILPSLMHWWQYIGLNYVIVKCNYADEHQRQFIPSQRPILFFIGFCALITLIQYGPYAFLHFQSPQIQYMNVWNSLFLGLGMVHYLLDGFIWRFREQYNREALLVPLLNARAQRQSPAMGPTQ